MENKKVIEENRERLNQIINDSKAIIIATDKGSAIIGDKIWALSLFASIISNLKKCGVKREELEYALNLGLESDEKIAKNEPKKGKNNFEEMIKDALTMIRDDIDSMLGADKDE